MTRILGISGSLRAGSCNTALLRAAAAVAGDGVVVEIATLHGIRLYDGDLEQRAGMAGATRQVRRGVRGVCRPHGAASLKR